MIIGTHGIGQQRMGRHQIKTNWVDALADGLERAHGGRVPDPSFDVAFYGDLFLPPRRRDDAHLKGSSPVEVQAFGDVSAEEVSDLMEAMSDLGVSDLELEAAASAEDKSFGGRTPRPVIAAMRVLDSRFGVGSGALYFGNLRQVRRYLTDETLKNDADARVREAVTQGGNILIGHSLGSVAAFEYVRLNPEHRLDLLLTIGSPLGWKAVQRLMPDADFARETGKPANVMRWVNLRDARDPVCAVPLNLLWRGAIEPPMVNNGKDAHSAARYLSQFQAGTALLRADPTLAA